MSKPEPIPVRMVRFAEPQDGPGLSVASACTTDKSRHTISYMPWLRHFLFEYRDQAGNILEGFIHESRIAWWRPVDTEAFKSAGSPPAEVKRRAG